MTYSGAVLLSPLLNGIDVSEEQQDLPGAALLSLREKHVVAGDTQRPSAGRVQRLSEDNILHVGRLNVLRKLHSTFLEKTTLPSRTSAADLKSLPQLWYENESRIPVRSPGWVRLQMLSFLLADKESINSPLFLHIVWLKLTSAFFTQVVVHETATKDGSARFL